MKADCLCRPAGAADQAVLDDLAFRSKASNGYDREFMEACRDELTINPDHFDAADHEIWLAERTGGRILGFIHFTHSNGSAEVEAMFVDPELKGGGIGALLWNRFESRARALGLRGIHLDADPNAVGFYEKMGLTIGSNAQPLAVSQSATIKQGRFLFRRLRIMKRSRLPHGKNVCCYS